MIVFGVVAWPVELAHGDVVPCIGSPVAETGSVPSSACIAACPIDVLILEPPIIAIKEELCTHCEICIPTCPVHALSIMEVES